MFFLIPLGVIAILAIGATVTQVVRDGYRRVPDRPGTTRS
ncbi:MAG: hypothetical protein JWN09_239 [Microbacteriaceae bacterium]|nr:hypothetical protein [Microbacteriaceae bacterium]